MKAFITGITGQDGSYLAELLLAKGYEVHGLMRRSSSFNTGRIEHLYHDQHDPGQSLVLHHGDLLDGGALARLLSEIKPAEIYNLGAQSHVAVSFEQPVYTADAVALGALRLFDAARAVCPQARIYQAGSSEMFGDAPAPQSETTPFRPCSPYAAAKVFAHNMAVNYREAYGMFIANGILFNHESPRRGETFVTRKITRAAGRIKEGLQERVYLGNLFAKRDWGFAGDYVKAMWLMLQANKPDDYVIATGEAHTVESFGMKAFGRLGLDFHERRSVDARYMRPAEVPDLRGNASKARRELGWASETGFDALTSMMVNADWELAKRERRLA